MKKGRFSTFEYSGKCDEVRGYSLFLLRRVAHLFDKLNINKMNQSSRLSPLFTYILFSLLVSTLLLSESCFLTGGDKSQGNNEGNGQKQGTGVVRPYDGGSGNGTGTGSDSAGNGTGNQTPVIRPDKTEDPEKDDARITDTQKTNQNDDQTEGKSDPKGYEEIKIIPTSFNIGVFLPFNLSYYTPYDTISPKSMMALELYEGLLLGLEEVSKNSGVNFNVQTFDTNNNAEQVSGLLAKPEMRNMDLFIGPIFNKPLKRVASFAKANQIPLISPLSPSTSITSLNPYYFVVSPSIETHCKEMVRYAQRQYPNMNLLIVHGPKPNERNLADKLYREFSVKGEGYANGIAVLPYLNQSEEELVTYLSPMQENIILITSFDELLINDLSRKFSLLSQENRLSVFGMPNWLRMESLQLDYLSNVNFHTTKPFYGDERISGHQFFVQNFKQRYNTYPQDNAMTGYDIGLHFGGLLKEYGKYFPDNYNKTGIANSKAIYNDFEFKPTVPNASPGLLYDQFDYFENKSVNVIRFNRDFTFQKVN